MSAPTDVIAQAITRLAVDYDQALAMAGGDESMVTLYLPGEWTILARRVCALIVQEVEKRAAVGAGPGVETAAGCASCSSRLFRFMYDPATALRYVQCASCGARSHV